VLSCSTPRCYLRLLRSQPTRPPSTAVTTAAHVIESCGAVRHAAVGTIVPANIAADTVSFARAPTLFAAAHTTAVVDIDATIMLCASQEGNGGAAIAGGAGGHTTGSIDSSAPPASGRMLCTSAVKRHSPPPSPRSPSPSPPSRAPPSEPPRPQAWVSMALNAVCARTAERAAAWGRSAAGARRVSPTRAQLRRARLCSGARLSTGARTSVLGRMPALECCAPVARAAMARRRTTRATLHAARCCCDASVLAWHAWRGARARAAHCAARAKCGTVAVAARSTAASHAAAADVPRAGVRAWRWCVVHQRQRAHRTGARTRAHAGTAVLRSGRGHSGCGHSGGAAAPCRTN